MNVPVPGWGTATIAALCVLVAGCSARNPSGRQVGALGTEKLILAQVVDEADALAWAGQIEGRALDLLLKQKVDAGAKYAFPDLAQLAKDPAEYRGRPVRFCGKLVGLETLGFSNEAAPLGKLWRGVVLLPGAGMVAFIICAEREPTREAVGAGMKVALKLPPKGSDVCLEGRFFKRWAAMDAGGRDYVVLPLVAAHSLGELPEAKAAPLAGLAPPTGKLPLKPIPAPEVWTRPVIEVRADGSLLLDGKRTNWDGLHEAIYPQAARHRNPLGDSALAVVVICDPQAPGKARERARKLPREHGARCVFRLLK